MEKLKEVETGTLTQGLLVFAGMLILVLNIIWGLSLLETNAISGGSIILNAVIYSMPLFGLAAIINLLRDILNQLRSRL